MPSLVRSLVLGCVVALLAFPAVASAGHTTDPRSRNVEALGHLDWPAKFQAGAFISDIAFWGNYAIEGSYTGFRIVDMSNPNNPVQISEAQCGQSQGDITISPNGNIVVRSQDTARVLPGNDLAQACDPGTSTSLQNGFEGLQIFDVSNKAAPRFVKAVHTDFGSHTHTQYYDRANNRLIIYVSRGGTREGTPGGYTAGQPYGGQNWPAGNGCITAVAVPLDNPAGAAVVNRCIAAGSAPASVTAGGCHDVAVYEGIKRLYGACRPNMILWDITDPVNPRVLHDQQYPGITGWHSAAISWNGEYLYSGWEPGGGSDPRCQATGSTLTGSGGVAGPTQTDAMKTIFVWRASDGALVGRWVLPQEQSQFENCTIHNYNLAPYPDRHILVQGNYQAGWSVVDFTDPTAATQVAFADPPTIDADPVAPGIQTVLGGEWSTHWWNNLIVATDIREGINVWRLTDSWWGNGKTLPYMNPQTMTDRLTCRVTVSSRALRQGTRRTVRARVLVNGEALAMVNVRMLGAGVSRLLKTNDAGVVSASVKPTRAGTLRVTASALNVSACSTSKRVAKKPRGAGVAGAGAGGGAGLTGRIR